MKRKTLARRIFEFYAKVEADTGIDPSILESASDKESVEFVVSDVFDGGDQPSMIRWYFNINKHWKLGRDILAFIKENNIPLKTR